MRNKGISLLIPLLFLCLLVLVLGTASGQMLQLSQVRFQDSLRQMDLAPFEDTEDGRHYLALPAYLPLEELTLSCPWYLEAELLSEEDRTLYGLSDSLPLDQPLTLTLSLPWGQQAQYPLQFIQCSTGRTIALEVQEGTMEHLNADKSRKRDTNVTILDGTGTLEYQGLGTLSGRGNATWDWPKKPYNLDFPEAVTIGPFEGIDKLCIFAEYTDESKLRNSLGYYGGQLLGIPYSSPYEFADIFINGQYYGLCALAVKSEYENHIEADGIQAVFELTSSSNGTQFGTDLQQQIRVIYGDFVDIQYTVECFESALAAQDWDTVSQYIDRDAWALKYAFDEFLFDPDLGWASKYFYIGRDGLIRPMLPWDYEWIINSQLDGFEPGANVELAAFQNYGNWFGRLLSWDGFCQSVASVLETRFTDDFFAALSQHMAADIQTISGSWRCDRLRWRSTLYDYQKIVLYPGKLLQDDIQEFTSYFPNRRSFMLDYFSHPEDFLTVLFRYRYSPEDTGGHPARFMLVLPKGTDLSAYQEIILESTANYQGDIFGGWFAEDGTPLADIGIVNEDLFLYGICYTP